MQGLDIVGGGGGWGGEGRRRERGAFGGMVRGLGFLGGSFEGVLKGKWGF